MDARDIEIERLRKRCIALAIAFHNIESERKYLRQRLELLQELANRILSIAVPYAGQDNKYEPSAEELAFISEGCANADQEART